jgi:molybdate transport system substrate-binding protein
MKRLVASLPVAVLALACSTKIELDPRTYHVFAAASLRDACEEIGKSWEVEHPTDKVVFEFAASNVLAEQIVISHSHGADLFISADAASLDVVRKAGQIVQEGPRPWLSDPLVVVVPAARTELKIESAADLARPEFAKLSLANPENVPAGRQAQDWLQSKGVWPKVARRVLPGLDERAALAAVELQLADAAIVHASEAVLSDKARIAFRVPLDEGPRSEFAIAVIDGPAGEESWYPENLLAFFVGAEAGQIFTRRGFVVPSNPR